MNTPKMVLIHGGNTGSWIWSQLLSHLKSEAIAVDLPGRPGKPAAHATLTIDEWVNSVVTDLNACSTGRVILVAHSLAGALMPGLVSRLSGRVVRIVLIAAAVPSNGRTPLDFLDPLSRVFNQWLAHHYPQGWVPPSWFLQLFVRPLFRPDVDTATVTDLAPKLGTEPPRVFTSPVTRTHAFATVPVTYIRTLRDHALRLDRQEQVIASLSNVERVDLDTGHYPMLSRPYELAAVLDQIAMAS